MQKSKLHQAFDLLLAQMERAQTCNKSEMENEFKRSEQLAELATAAADLAWIEAKVFLTGGFLPENSIIAVPDDAKLLQRSNYAESKKKPSLLDEFTKK